jgi:hypothetical protein
MVRATGATSWTYTATLPSAGVPLSLGAGWNLIALPDRAARYDAPGLLRDVTQTASLRSLPDPGARELDRWQDGSWEGHLLNVGANAFTLEEGRGYFLKLTQPANWTP